MLFWAPITGISPTSGSMGGVSAVVVVIYPLIYIDTYMGGVSAVVVVVIYICFHVCIHLRFKHTVLGTHLSCLRH